MFQTVLQHLGIWYFMEKKPFGIFHHHPTWLPASTCSTKSSILGRWVCICIIAECQHLCIVVFKELEAQSTNIQLLLLWDLPYYVNVLYSGKRKAVTVGGLLSFVVNLLSSKQKPDKTDTLGHNTMNYQIKLHTIPWDILLKTCVS